MHNKLIIIFLLSLFSLSKHSSAQTLIEKISQEFCDCLEYNKIETMRASRICLEDLYIENLVELKQYYKVQRIGDVDIKDFVNKLMVDLYVNCPYAINMVSNINESNQNIIEKQKNLKCEDVKKGDFYYLSDFDSKSKKDTIYISLTDKFYIERSNRGRNYSLLYIEWKNDCKFDLELIESNDKFKKALSDKIGIYHYEILQNDSTSVTLKSIETTNQGQFELIKIK